MAVSLSLLAAVCGFVAGAIVGSFLATVTLRAGGTRSALVGRSACESCGRTLTPLELVPLVSFVWQRGRCRRCGARIDPAHVAIELLAGLIAAIALAIRPDAFGIAGTFFGLVLLLLAALDLRLFWLPDRLTLPLAAGGLAAAALGPPDLGARAIGAVAGYAVLEGLRLIYARVRGRAGLGGGDPKLMAAIGAWLGWAALPGVLLGASLLGLAAAGVARLRGQAIGATTALPFGALLAPAAFLTWLFVAG